jgi:hypothetical protein
MWHFALQRDSLWSGELKASTGGRTSFGTRGPQVQNPATPTNFPPFWYGALPVPDSYSDRNAPVPADEITLSIQPKHPDCAEWRWHSAREDQGKWRRCGIIRESALSLCRCRHNGHWTAAEKRLNRDLKNRFGTKAYAAEELVAELTAAFLCAHLGIQGELRHAGYIADWIMLLKEDDRAVFTAASKASQAAEFLRAFSEDTSAEENEPAA